ncbi:cupin domain-containing protein [Methylobacterium sp. SyP6R]|uniref:cupin domain-containing protein n=1 Tax=Methylobacterium sp. SyP6R TaxID=2718876 RepID=UPI001F3ABF8C|nr:cupin domain-containing protein [Methylobacterium sp. SyP6R]MCF4124753.1 cupin domain-containing protein [Methylobacterium sp. SyP6R]
MIGPARIAAAMLLLASGALAQEPTVTPPTVTPLTAQPPAAGEARVAVVFDQAIPNVPGKSLRAVLVEYGPNGASPAHTHARSAFIVATVLAGAIRSRVNDGPERVYEAGESFTERPGDRHGVSANASATEPARLLAVFVVDTAETTLTTPIH